MDDGFTLTLSGLIRKRAEVGGVIDSLTAQLEQRMAEMHALDATIRIFKPDIDLEDLRMRRVPPAHATFRGEMARFFLDQLRKHSKGLTTAEMADAVMTARKLNKADLALGRTILRRTGHSLTRLRKNGFLRSEKATAGGMLRWWAAVPEGEPVGGWRNGSS